MWFVAHSIESLLYNQEYTKVQGINHGLSDLAISAISNQKKNLVAITVIVRTYLQPHYGNGVFGNVYLSAGQH